jgi:ribosome-binding protein aMBF1 (putative translation factor)
MPEKKSTHTPVIASEAKQSRARQRPDPAAVDTPAARIRARRAAAGLTQTALARQIGVSHDSMISRWESGANTPGPRYARALAAALGGTLEDYLPE